MFRLKLSILLLLAGALAFSCAESPPQRFSIATSKKYEASIFRQNCSICHGSEAEGKTLDDGRQIPDLRQAPFKYNTDEQIYQHIADGGNGMVPFRGQLSERELRAMVEFVKRDLREQ